uniref:MDM4 regulator of p53 n=1 Tax=Crocodylus porosus TaxID=8502 RepID=A0A7M4EWD3_CROPO
MAITREGVFFCFTCHLDAAQTLVHAKDQSIDNASRDQPKSSTEGVSDVGSTEGESNAPALSTSEHKSGNCEEKDLLESSLKSRSPKPDLALEEWDVAGLPWWFIGNLKNNYGARSSGSTDIQNNQDIDTAIVSDTTDDLWFLNESAPDQLNVIAEVETADCEEGKESDKQETEATYFDDPEDSQCLDDDVDTEIPSELGLATCGAHRIRLVKQWPGPGAGTPRTWAGSFLSEKADSHCPVGMIAQWLQRGNCSMHTCTQATFPRAAVGNSREDLVAQQSAASVLVKLGQAPPCCILIVPITQARSVQAVVSLDCSPSSDCSLDTSSD